MKNSRSSSQIGAHGALPADLLKRIVGGAKLDEKRNIDGNTAAEMTAGADEAAAHGAVATITPNADPKTPAANAAVDGKAGALTDEDAKAVEAHFRENISKKLMGETGDRTDKSEAKRTFQAYDFNVSGKGDKLPEAKPAESKPQEQGKAGSSPVNVQKVAELQGQPGKLDDGSKPQAAAAAGKLVEAHKPALEKTVSSKPAVVPMLEQAPAPPAKTAIDKTVAAKPAAVPVLEAAPAPPQKAAMDKTVASKPAADKNAAGDGHKPSVADKGGAKAGGAADDDVGRPRSNAIYKNPDAPPPVKKTVLGEAKNDAWKNASMVAGKAGEAWAKELAKNGGTHEKNENEKVLAGGITTTVEVGGKTTTRIGQVTSTTETESFSTGQWHGKSTAWTGRAEAGVEKTTTEDLGNGASRTTTDKAYATTSVQGSAKYSFTAGGLDAEAALKVVAHAEARHTDVFKVGDVENATTLLAEGHAEAGAKAGFHLGYDGLKVSVKVSAEASIQAGVSNETKIGDVKLASDIKVFAKASAQAQASAEVTFNPLEGKAKIKIEAGAMASAGIGVEANGGVFNKSGNGVGAGANVQVGAVGVKFSPDLDIKDGKMKLKIEMGGALGVGITGNVQINGDLNQAKTSFLEGFKQCPISGSWMLLKAGIGFFS